MVEDLSGQTIDLSRLPAPAIIEALDYETLQGAFLDRFKTVWTAARAIDPTLPAYDVDALETDPVVIASQAWSYLRLLDRSRVNDAVKAVLAPLAKGTNLDAVVARANVQRLTITPARGATPAVMEGDERLLMRYLLAFSRPAAGSREGYLYDVYTALPTLYHAQVNGRAVHGRRGDVDVVLAGPDGRDLTDQELATCRAALFAANRKPEAVAVTALRASRIVYAARGSILVAKGPDAETVRLEAVTRLTAAAAGRMLIGGVAPVNALEGALYGSGVVRAHLDAPAADIGLDAYSIPVLGDVAISATAQT